jgi:hypothetical protein
METIERGVFIVSSEIVGWALWREGKYHKVYLDYDDARAAQSWSDTLEPKTQRQINQLEKLGYEIVTKRWSVIGPSNDKPKTKIIKRNKKVNSQPQRHIKASLERIISISDYKPDILIDLIEQAKSQNRHSKEYVYLIEAKENMIKPRYKIGYSRKPDSRIKANTMSPVELNLLHCIQARNGTYLEAILKHIFEFLRVKGEWFELGKSDLIWLQSLESIDGEKLWSLVQSSLDQA